MMKMYLGNRYDGLISREITRSIEAVCSHHGKSIMRGCADTSMVIAVAKNTLRHDLAHV